VFGNSMLWIASYTTKWTILEMVYQS